MASLDLDTITQLLKEDKVPKKQRNLVDRDPSVISIGPLKRTPDNANAKCVSNRCGTPAYFEINGASYCTTHTVHELNRIILKLTGLGWVVDECTCKAGYYSKQNRHSDDCAIYEKIKQAAQTLSEGQVDDDHSE